MNAAHMGSSKLEALAAIAHRGAEAARAELIRDRDALDRLADQHVRLRRYVEEYRDAPTGPSTVTGAASLAHRHRFIARLEAQADEMWAAIELRREAMLPVVERHREAAAREAALMSLYANAERDEARDRTRRELADIDVVVALRLRADHHASLSPHDPRG